MTIAVETKPKPIPTRDEIEDRFKWNLKAGCRHIYFRHHFISEPRPDRTLDLWDSLLRIPERAETASRHSALASVPVSV